MLKTIQNDMASLKLSGLLCKTNLTCFIWPEKHTSLKIDFVRINVGHSVVLGFLSVFKLKIY